MVVLFALLFPAVLLGLMLAMERVEAPLRAESVGEHVAEFLDKARPEDVEAYVREGAAAALARHWRRTARRRQSARDFSHGQRRPRLVAAVRSPRR